MPETKITVDDEEVPVNKQLRSYDRTKDLTYCLVETTDGEWIHYKEHPDGHKQIIQRSRELNIAGDETMVDVDVVVERLQQQIEHCSPDTQVEKRELEKLQDPGVVEDLAGDLVAKYASVSEDYISEGIKYGFAEITHRYAWSDAGADAWGREGLDVARGAGFQSDLVPELLADALNVGSRYKESVHEDAIYVAEINLGETS